MFALNKSLFQNLKEKRLDNELGDKAKELYQNIDKVKKTNDFQRIDLDKIQAELNSTKIVKKPNNELLEILNQKFEDFK